MPILRYSAASPYARKVRIAAALTGVALDLVDASTTDPADSLRVQNPLGKVPTLILDGGEIIYDSRVIVDYLDSVAGGGKLIPLDPAARIAALTFQALGDGVNDAALLIRYESARPETLRSSDWIALQAGKVERALGALERDPPSGPITIGHIALASALGYQDIRFGGAWRKTHPALVSWLEAFSREVPAYETTGVA